MHRRMVPSQPILGEKPMVLRPRRLIRPSQVRDGPRSRQDQQAVCNALWNTELQSWLLALVEPLPHRTSAISPLWEHCPCPPCPLRWFLLVLLLLAPHRIQGMGCLGWAPLCLLNLERTPPLWGGPVRQEASSPSHRPGWVWKGDREGTEALRGQTA